MKNFVILLIFCISESISFGNSAERSQIIFAGTRLDSPVIEQIKMPYAVGQLYRGWNNQPLMALYFFEKDVSDGSDPCLNLNLINSQVTQRSFTVINLDYASRAPQLVNGNNSGTYFTNGLNVFFQAMDKSSNVSLLENSFSGTVTVLKSSFRSALVRFDHVMSSTNCFRTPENKSLACGARISGQLRIGLCR